MICTLKFVPDVPGVPAGTTEKHWLLTAAWISG